MTASIFVRMDFFGESSVASFEMQNQLRGVFRADHLPRGRLFSLLDSLRGCTCVFSRRPGGHQSRDCETVIDDSFVLGPTLCSMPASPRNNTSYGSLGRWALHILPACLMTC